MGYYHIELTPNSSALCTIILPWGKYEYLKLPMGLANSQDIFQEKMGDLFANLENIQAYIDNLLVLTKGNWEDHLAARFSRAWLKLNIKNPFLVNTN